MNKEEKKIADKVTRKIKGEMSFEDMIDEYCKERQQPQREYMMLVSKEWLDDWKAALQELMASTEKK